MNRSLLELLKDLSAIVVGAAAVLYVFGYTVHLAYFRLLGIEMIGQPLDYIRLAADYCASIISSLPQLLFGIRYYFPKLMERPILITTILCLLIILLLILLNLPSRKLKFRLMRRRFFRQKLQLQLTLLHSLSLLIIISLGILLYVEYDVAKVRNVLQPVDAADIQQMLGQPTNRDGSNWQGADSLALRSKNISRVYQKYVQSQKSTPGYHNWNNWFNPITRPNSGEERSARYLALLLINIVLLIAIVHQIYFFRKSTKRKAKAASNIIRDKSRKVIARSTVVMLSIALSFQLLLLPFVYATLGRYFTYPIVTLKINRQISKEMPSNIDAPGAAESKTSFVVREPSDLLDPSWTHGVYLIAQTDSEVIVYDRLNFFRIKHVPRAQILNIDQLFNASPFDSCSKQEDEFIPCEMLWMPEEKPISNF